MEELTEGQQDTTVPKSQGYLNQSFSQVKRGGIKGEVKRGERDISEGTEPEGERGGKNEGKGVGGKGPEKNSHLGTPMIEHPYD